MSDDAMKAELERLRQENAALKRGASAGLRMKVSEKGALSIYGMGRFPVTLYKEQWLKLLDMADDIRAFIAANEDSAQGERLKNEDSMTKYLLVSFKTCPWVQRAAIVLREKKIDFEFRHIDRDNRPDWFLAISPHKKVPVLRIDDTVSLFESNAIAEYLDETIAPRLHPDDPVQRAVNRAWTDYVPDFSDQVTGVAYAADEAAARNASRRYRRRSNGWNARWRSRARDRSSTARNIRWSTPAMRRSCSATSSSTASGRSARSRSIRG